MNAPILRIAFSDDNSEHVIDFGSRKEITLPTYTNTFNQTTPSQTVVEVGFLPVQSYTGGHFGQVFIKNKGAPGFRGFGQIDMAAHPKYVRIELDTGNPTLHPPQKKLFGHDTLKNHEIHAQMNINGMIFYIRDGSLRQPTAMEFTSQGKIVAWCLDERPSTPYGYPVHHKQYNTSVVEDPLSVNCHRLPGGTMYMWDVGAVQESQYHFSYHDPMPAVTDRLRELVFDLPSEFSSMRDPRHKALLDSLTNFGVNGVHSMNNTGMPWYLYQGGSRFGLTVWDHRDNMFDVNPRALNCHWQVGPGSLVWAEGVYNNGYNWVLALARAWVDNPTAIIWSILDRFCKWELTTAINWAEIGTGSLGNRRGYHHYEKSLRNLNWPSEVGTQYHPSEYKQYSESVLVARELFKDQWFAEEGFGAHLDALKNKMHFHYKNHNGDYGIRTIGWGMRNPVAAWRYTGDEAFKTNAIEVARNWMLQCKRPDRIDEASAQYGDEDPFLSPTEGLPYVVNNANNWDVMQIWEWAKVLTGLIEVKHYLHTNEFDQKIDQMFSWFFSECVHEDADALYLTNWFHPNRISAFYLNATIPTNVHTWASAHLSWFLLPISYGVLAGVRRSDCARILPRLIQDCYEGVDTNLNPISYQFWEGMCDITHDGSSILIHPNIDLDGVLAKTGAKGQRWHGIRLEDTNQMSTVLSCDHISNNIIHIDNPTPGWLTHKTNVKFQITGPLLNMVTSDKCKAVKGWVENMVTRPNPSRPFSWRNGAHFNTWPKNVIMPLQAGDLPYLAMKFIASNPQLF